LQSHSCPDDFVFNKNYQASQRVSPVKEKVGMSATSKDEEDSRTSKETAMLIQQKVTLLMKHFACAPHDIPLFVETHKLMRHMLDENDLIRP